MKSNEGMTKSASFTPSQGEWSMDGVDSPQKSTNIMSAIVIPRNTSRDTNRSDFLWVGESISSPISCSSCSWLISCSHKAHHRFYNSGTDRIPKEGIDNCLDDSKKSFFLGLNVIIRYLRDLRSIIQWAIIILAMFKLQQNIMDRNLYNICLLHNLLLFKVVSLSQSHIISLLSK